MCPLESFLRVIWRELVCIILAFSNVKSIEALADGRPVKPFRSAVSEKYTLTTLIYTHPIHTRNEHNTAVKALENTQT